ncbi:MAG: hypothetical protein HPY79_09170 [Bacteroidales bacterium]|nr:hypothetical protein [Bacteroidales bacterium]
MKNKSHQTLRIVTILLTFLCALTIETIAQSKKEIIESQKKVIDSLKSVIINQESNYTQQILQLENQIKDALIKQLNFVNEIKEKNTAIEKYKVELNKCNQERVFMDDNGYIVAELELVYGNIHEDGVTIAFKDKIGGLLEANEVPDFIKWEENESEGMSIIESFCNKKYKVKFIHGKFYHESSNSWQDKISIINMEIAE